MNNNVPVLNSTPVNNEPVLPTKKKSKIGLLIGLLMLLIALIGGGIALFFFVIKPNLIDEKEDKEKKVNWQELYLDYLKEEINENRSIGLVDMNNDNIPELILVEENYIYSISTIKKSKIETYELIRENNIFNYVNYIYNKESDTDGWYLLTGLVNEEGNDYDETFDIYAIEMKEFLNQEKKWSNKEPHGKNIDGASTLFPINFTLDLEEITEDDYEEIFNKMASENGKGYVLEYTISEVKKSINQNNKESEKEDDNKTPSYSNKEALKELSFTELKDKLANKESFILVISQSYCSHCMEYKPKLKEILEKNNIEAFYIEYDLLSDSEKQTIKDNFPFTGTPTTINIQKGKEIDAENRIVGSSTEEKIEKYLKENGYIK